MNLNGISNIKRELILEALSAWHKSKHRPSKFLEIVGKLGWKKADGYGSFKTCLCKGSIAVKYAKSTAGGKEEVRREYEQYNMMPPELKKYFARIYILQDGLLIQDKVLVPCKGGSSCKLSTVKGFFGSHRMHDCWHNHGYSRKGTLKFYDWVFQRDWPWLNDPNKPLKMRRK